MLIKYVYIVFMGILLATFVGVGIAAFYKGPVAPEYPSELQYQNAEKPSDATEASRLRKLSDQNNQAYKVYNQKNEIYNRNVSIIAIIAAIIMLTLSLTFFKQILVIADGLMLGGVITLGYAVIRGFSSNDDMYRFLVVSVGLIITLVLGYIKFVAPNTKSK